MYKRMERRHGRQFAATILDGEENRGQQMHGPSALSTDGSRRVWVGPAPTKMAKKKLSIFGGAAGRRILRALGYGKRRIVGPPP